MRSFLVIFLLLWCQQSTLGFRVLGVFPVPGRSHFVIAHELMKGLAERGHQVDVITHFPLNETIPNYNYISLAGSFPNIVNNMSFDDMSLISQRLDLSYFVDRIGTQVCDLLELPQIQAIIENPPQDPPYDVVVAELFASPCYLAFGRHLNVPVVGLTTCMFHDWLNYPTGNPLNTAVTPSLFSAFNQKMTFRERFLNTILTQLVVHQMNYYTRVQNHHVQKHFGSNMPDVLDLQKDISVFLVNSHYSLNGIRPWTPAVVEIGGLHINRKDDVPLSPEVQAFLNESEHGFVYFTFGSMARFETFPREVIDAFYGAFRNIAPIRVLMKIAKPEELPPGLPKNVFVQRWFPQISILKHKKILAFLTHGGLMGTMEAVAHGVPLVGVPLFGDQYINMQNYVNKKIAISFDLYKHVTEEKLTNALKTIYTDPSYKQNAQKLSQLFLDRPISPMDTAVFWIDYVIKHGNILQSPLVHMHWWQRYLVDVYGVIITLLIIVVMLLLCIFKIVRRLFTRGSVANEAELKDKLKKKKQK